MYEINQVHVHVFKHKQNKLHVWMYIEWSVNNADKVHVRPNQ